MFDVHVIKWAVFSDVDPMAFPERAVRAGADGVGFLPWCEIDPDVFADACADAAVDWVSTAAGEAAGNTGHEGSAMTDPDCHEAAVDAIVETCERVGEYVDNVVVTIGPDQAGVDEAVQQRAIVDASRDAAPAAADADVTLVVEPLNVRVDHPGYFLTTTDRGIEIVDAVDHEHVCLLYDVYHQQITEGDILARPSVPRSHRAVPCRGRVGLNRTRHGRNRLENGVYCDRRGGVRRDGKAGVRHRSGPC